ncbi:MAG: rhodanese-like domain-containing protein [Pseudomonadota bacterium]
MSGDPGLGVENVLPADAWTILSNDRSSQLIDVRTRAEWGFVGVPDLSELDREPLFIEWSVFPDMSINPRFVADVHDALRGQWPEALLFICRSGVRSRYAAEAVAEALLPKGASTRCMNVAEGFEGDLDPENHRGRLNGWKARGLAWRQS